MTTFAQKIVVQDPLRYLALGDSYTIGESVAPNERWSFQLLEALKVKGVKEASLKIIATTGWRTDQLMQAIQTANLTETYNLVSLLIGVNNQYQGRSVENYAVEFEELLKKAISLAGHQKENVFVVSIPDYAYTPFGQQRPQPSVISQQIDQFNRINKGIAEKYNVNYFDITPISREGLANPAYVAKDGLHPSGKMYAEWVKIMLPAFTLATLLPSDTEENQLSVIYPNPTENIVVIDVPEAQQTKVKLYLTDEKGIVLCYQEVFALTTTAFSLKNLPAGLYFLLIDNAKNVKRAKVIKQ
ncbi:MAG: GDSL-type esterase/lipase family protein [Flammeovirgaceae bacterium]|nr:GDSL-type esterase/lipase family protein [Flammeovirgaceae bacterium]MDW8286551.1 GDSL-type esterase/lipase family protein [Flammeovirgaceae bacterium]